MIRKWSGEGQPLMQMETVHFDPQKVNVMFGSHLHSAETSNLARREFARSLKLTVPVEYMATPSKIMRRMKKHAYGCSVGDIVCSIVVSDGTSKNKESQRQRRLYKDVSLSPHYS